MDHIVVWFRQDLRLSDHAALSAALAESDAVTLVYILDTTSDRWAPGAASRWWLHHSLAALQADAGALGGGLVLRKGEPLEELPRLVDRLGAKRIYFSRAYDPRGRALERALNDRCAPLGVEVKGFPGALLAEPASIETRSGTPFKVFTAFWRALQRLPAPPPPLPRPARLPAPPAVASDSLGSWQLRPRKPDWAAPLSRVWQPGEVAALAVLEQFLDGAAGDYAAARERPDLDGTSRLSPHLHLGELSPRTVWTRAREAARTRRHGAAGIDCFLRELVWREFSYHLLYHWPQLPDAPLRAEFTAFPWAADEAALRAWQQGSTGVPFVDAGMRQLWRTGWMHNRVRMVVASFLVKNLLLPWQTGEAWFWDTLVDADLASNAASWQWVAGCGTDAAPFFRVFNPVRQGQRFDPEGRYVKRWVPELERVPSKYVHEPGAMPQAMAAEIGFVPGRDYPLPIVDLGESRARALSAYRLLRAG